MENGIEKQEQFREMKELMKDFAIIVTLVYLMFGVIFNIVIVSGSSMLPTLHNGEIVLVKHAFYEVKKGDVIVCTPEHYKKQLIKRVIATEGDEVFIDFCLGLVMVNGVILDEDYINSPTNLFEGVEFPITVPKGKVFVLGDNRNASSDSRDTRIGCINVNKIKGGCILLFHK